jgi:hypothetical protein
VKPRLAVKKAFDRVCPAKGSVRFLPLRPAGPTVRSLGPAAILSAWFLFPSPAEAESGWRRYFPLGAGSSWTYALKNFRSGTTRRFTATVKGSRLVEAERRSMVIVDEDQLGEHLPVGYFEDDDGFLNRFVYLEYQGDDVVAPGTASRGQRILPPDPEVRSAWQQTELLLGVRHLWNFTIRRAIAVEVPAGRFVDCLLVETTGRSLNPSVAEATRATGQYRFLDWYAPGVGLVRSESRNTAAPETPEVVSELLRYELH